MKMLAFLGGELSNSAKYFSTFADVSTENYNNINRTFGLDESNTWKPWNYRDRIKVATAVEKMKTDISKKKIAKATKRTKITTFIVQQKSRQEFVPLISNLIDKPHVDPLHLKNNACALAHRHLLHMALALSNISNSVSSFPQILPNSPLFKYVEILRSQCSLSRLAKKIIKWFNDTRANGKDFDYRFTGKDSRLFLHNFMFCS